MKFTTYLTLILLSALIFISFSSVAYSSDSSMQKQALEDPNNPDVYVRISDQTLVFSYSQLLGIMKNGETLSKKEKTSFDAPLEADEISFVEEVTLPSYEQSYTVQYILDAGQTPFRNWLSEIKYELKTQGKTINDLPKKGKFYEHISNEEYGGVEYISANDVLVDLNGDPLVLSLCNTKLTPLGCTVSFYWKSDIKVRIRANETPQNLPQTDSVDVWLKAYPIYLETLNERVTQPAGGQ